MDTKNLSLLKLKKTISINTARQNKEKIRERIKSKKTSKFRIL